jgi:hypothetical protein
MAAVGPALTAVNAILPLILHDRTNGIPFTNVTLATYLTGQGYTHAGPKPTLILTGVAAADKAALANAILVHLAILYQHFEPDLHYDPDGNRVANTTDAEKYNHLEYFFTSLQTALTNVNIDPPSLVFYAIASKV